MSPVFELKLLPNGVAELNFNAKEMQVNTFSVPVLEELEGHLDSIKSNSAIKLLVLKSGKEEGFIAGADLHSFEPAFEDPTIAEKIIRTGHRVFSKLQGLPFPSLAVIHGACLGGGLECALSCTYRLVSDHPKTALALPEVTLGIYPGWGGTQRLPRLIGLENGLNMILTGKPVNAKTAWKMGLADQIVAWQFLEEKTQGFIQELLAPQGGKKALERRNRKTLRKVLLESNPLGRKLLYMLSEKEICSKTKGHYPAPLIALKLVEETYPLPLAEGLKKEADTFIANIPRGFAQAKYLISLFFTQEALKKDSGVDVAVNLTVIKEAAVLGAGTMGATLAWLLTNNSILTRLKDISWELVGRGYGTVKALYNKGIKNKKIAAYEADRKFNLLSGAIDYAGFQHVDFVLEAVSENLDLKKKIFNEIENAVSEEALIASNTSSLTIQEMAEGMKHPERFVGMHFFNPPNKMPLVEVVAGPQTSPQAVANAVALSKKLGKTPIVVGDCPGFLVNRIFMQGANEVLYLYQEGIKQEVLAKKLLSFGMPMDPFLLADEVGNDVAYKVNKTFEKAYGERMKAPRILELIYEAKLYGKKEQKGFYLYEGEKTRFNPAIEKLNASIAKQQTPSEEEITTRFILVMINEAAHCLEEGVIKKPAYLDMALIMGIGFPPYRGGLLRYADEMGIANVVRQLEAFSKYGVRFKPAQLLLGMQQKNSKFYP
ncbi:Fatty acid oxidation complex subunit alpha [Chlamydiales bacterium STE3]|nr:Fatty acid oxidation complex subunit alpha [Chlamydiales bacterium STE3]